MAERPDQIEQHIASTRHQLGSNLHELEDKVKQAADWKTYYERSPMTMVGLAFGGGVLLASMIGGKSERSTAYAAPTPRSAGYLTGVTQSGPVFDTWNNLKAALIGLTGAKIRGLLDEAIPGFSEHYDHAVRANPGVSHTSNHPQSTGHETPSHRM